VVEILITLPALRMVPAEEAIISWFETGRHPKRGEKMFNEQIKFFNFQDGRNIP